MKQTITIEVPEGKEMIQEKGIDGSIRIGFVDEEPGRSKSWEEFCRNHYKYKNEWYITSTATIYGVEEGIRSSTCYNHLSTKEDAEGILALIKLTRLHDEWVGDWKGDYNDYATKYQIICSGNENEPSVNYHYTEHSLLDFPNKKMADKFLDCFKDLIIKAKKFI